MPWKVCPMRQLRLSAVHRVTDLHRPIAQVAREFSVSRKTLYKWLRRAADHPADPLEDRSRRPAHCPGKTGPATESDILRLRDAHGWGPRKIHARLLAQNRSVPSITTVANVLTRNGRIAPTPPSTPRPQRFERSEPNQLWQIDHKGPIEVQRQKITPLSILDDHSRYALAFEPCLDKTMARVWEILWAVMGEAGMPQAILCDNAFGTTGRRAPGLSWFDARLIRLGIHPAHGRPHHPQTQGKVERFHGSAQGEFIYFNARRDDLEHFTQDCRRWLNIYNLQRPHEALGDLPPITRWKPSDRKRPDTLPEVSYPAGATLRKVAAAGDITYRNCRILCGAGLIGQWVQVEERNNSIDIHYAWKRLRSISTDQVRRGTLL